MPNPEVPMSSDTSSNTSSESSPWRKERKGGQFYTTPCVVQLLVEMLEPFKGRVMDPCCGSGGMFVQSEKFVTEHSGRVSDISIYGQESNQTTWRLCKMNLAIRGIDSTQVKWNAEGSFLNNAHKDVKVDYIIANPPFNQDDWGGDQLRNDARWTYGVPPEGNANYGWIQHFLYHLAPGGQAGFVLSKGSMTTKTGGEDDIRRTLVDEGLVDCIVNLPSKLFLNTQIPVCLWFMRKERSRPKAGFRNTDGEILFIDARDSGEMVNRRLRELTDDDIARIAGLTTIGATTAATTRMLRAFAHRFPSNAWRNSTTSSPLAATWALQTKKTISTSRSASPHFAPSLSPN